MLRDAPEKLYAALPLDGSFPFPFSREEDRVFLRSLLVERKYANISTIESTQVELENFFRFFKQDIHFRWQSLKLMLAFIVGQKRYDLEKGPSPGENPTPDSSEGVSADLVKTCLNLFSPSPVQIKKDEREKYSKLIRSLAGLFTTDFLYAMPTVDKLEAVAGVKKREYDGAIRGLMAVVDGLERAPLDEDVAKAAMACAEGLRKNGMTLNGFRKIMLETEISKRSLISGLRREADALRMSGAHFYSLAAFYMELAEQLVVLSTDEKQLIHAMVLTGDEKPEEAMRALKGELPEPDQGLLKDVCRYFSSPTCQSGRSVSEKIERVRGKLSDNISVHDFANPSGALGPRYLGRTHTSAANTFQRRASLRVLGVLGNLNLTERRYLAAMAHLVENSQSPGDTSKTAAGIFLSQAPPVMDYTTMAQRCVALFQTNKSQYQTLQKFLVRALAVASRPGKSVEKDFHFNFYSAARAFEDDEKNKDLLEAVAALDEFETGDGLGEFLAFGELLEKPEVNQVPAGTASESARRLAFGPSFVGYYERFSQGRHPDPRTAATANREQFWKDFDVFINGLLSPTSRLPEAVAAFEDFVQFLVTMSEAENVNRFPVLTKIPGTEALRLLNPASPPALVLLYRLLQKEYSSCVPHYLRPGMVGFKIDGAERVVAAAKKILDFYKTILEGHLLTELRNLLESLDGGKKYDEDTVNRAHKLLNRIGKSVKSEPLALALNYIELSDKYSKHPETPTHPWSELGSSVELPAAEPPSSFETNTDMTTYEGDEPPSANS